MPDNVPELDELEDPGQVVVAAYQAWQHLRPLVLGQLSIREAQLRDPANTRDQDMLLKGSILELKWFVDLPDRLVEQIQTARATAAQAKEEPDTEAPRFDE